MLFGFALSLNFMSSSQTVYPDFTHQTLSEVREARDWIVLTEAKGNLTRGGGEDIALVLESKDVLLETRCEGCEEQKSKARIVLVLSAGKVIAQNNLFIARANEGGTTGDITPALSIVNNQLDIFYMLVRGEDHYIFEMKKDDIVLVKASKLRASHYLFRSDVVDFKKRELITENQSSADQPADRKTIKLKLDKKFMTLSELKMLGTLEIGGVFF